MSCSNCCTTVLHVISPMSGWFICCVTSLTESHCIAHSSVFVQLFKNWYQVAPVHSMSIAEDDVHPQRQNGCSSETGHRVFPLQLATMHCAYSFVSVQKVPLCDRCQHLSTEPVMQVVHVSNERYQAAVADWELGARLLC